MSDAQQRFRRIRGHNHISRLIAALEQIERDVRADTEIPSAILWGCPSRVLPNLRDEPAPRCVR